MVNIALSFFIIRSTATVSICSCGSIVIRNTVSATVHTAKTRISAVPIPSIPVFSEVSISTSVYPARHIPAANNMANTRFTRNTDRYPKSLYPGLLIFHLFYGSSLQRESKDVLQMGSTAISEREISQLSDCRSLKGLQP